MNRSASRVRLRRRFSKIAQFNIAVMLLAGLGTVAGEHFETSMAGGSQRLPHRTLLIDGRERGCISVATTSVAQERGLRGAALSAPPMAFLFMRPGRYGFWMAGVQLPISVAWVSGGRVIGAVSMAPESTAVYSSPVPIRLAVEFIAGRGLPPIGTRLSLGADC